VTTSIDPTLEKMERKRKQPLFFSLRKKWGGENGKWEKRKVSLLRPTASRWKGKRTDFAVILPSRWKKEWKEEKGKENVIRRQRESLCPIEEKKRGGAAFVSLPKKRKGGGGESQRATGARVSESTKEEKKGTLKR